MAVVACRIEDEVDGAVSNYSAWASRFTDWTSVHGLVWYNRTDKKCARLTIMIIAAIVVFGTPTFLIWQFLEWVEDVNIVSEGTSRNKSKTLPTKMLTIFPTYCIHQRSGTLRRRYFTPT